jgi:hypothetical protein
MNVLVDRTGLYQYVNRLVFLYILYPVWKQYHIEQLLKRQYKYLLTKQKWIDNRSNESFWWQNVLFLYY